MERQRVLFLVAVPVTIALALYLPTSAPTVYWSDTAEFQRVVYTLELPHPTGYPLYVLLARAWIALLPIGDVARAVTLFSVATATLSVGLLSWLTWRLTASALGALVAGLALATAPAFWSQAIVAEVYALHTLLVVALLASVLGARPYPVMLALLTGLALSHHRMAVLLVPGVLVALAVRRRELNLTLRTGVIATAALVAGLAPYVVTWWQGEWHSFAAFWTYVSHRGNAWVSYEALARYVPKTVSPLLQQQLGIAGVALAALGLVWLARDAQGSRRAAAACLGVSWLVAAGFFSVYRVPDIYAFLPHLQVLQAVLIGAGVASTRAWVLSRAPRTRRLWMHTGVWLVAAAALIVQGRAGWAANQHAPDEWYYPKARSLAVLGDVQSDAILVGDWLLGQTMLYLQAVEGVRSDLDIVIPPEKDPAMAVALLDSGRPVYLWGTSWVPLMEGDAEIELVRAEHSLFEEGLFRLVKRGALAAAPVHRQAVEAVVAPGLALDHLEIRPWPLRADDLAEISLCWSSEPVALAGHELILELDLENRWLSHTFGPLGDVDPTGCTHHRLVLPPAPFADEVEARLRLVADGESGEDLVLGAAEWQVQPWTGALAPERMTFFLRPREEVDVAGASLVGVEHEDVIRPGIGLPVTAAWWLTERANPALEVSWRLVDPAGAEVVSKRFAVAPAFASTDRERPGLVSARYVLQLPRRAAPGTYLIQVASSKHERPTVVGEVAVEDWERLWERPVIGHSTDYLLASGAVRLWGYDLVSTEGSIDVTLYWQCERAVENDWKVFVHLVDGNGGIVAQQDAVPGGGLRWTDGWLTGEHIEDHHRLELPAALAPGPYDIVVGMYDPRTSARVPVVAGSGRGGETDSIPLATLDLALPDHTAPREPDRGGKP